MAAKDVVFSVIYSIFNQILFTNTDKLGVSMSNSGLAYVIASLIIAIWMIVLLLKIPLLDV